MEHLHTRTKCKIYEHFRDQLDIAVIHSPSGIYMYIQVSLITV